MRILTLAMIPTPLHANQIKFYRILLLVSAFTYLLWWLAVQAFLPGSFNPFLSRALVASLFLLSFAVSFFWPALKARIELLFTACCWLTTLHYFYLFFENKADINWVVGSFITVIAVSACLQSQKLLLSYCLFVQGLSIGLALLDPFLLRTIFLPGILTILLFAYFGLRARVKLHEQLHQTALEQAALKSKNEFLSIASHELRTPLTTLKLLTQTTKKNLQKGQSFDPQTFVEQIDRQAERLGTLVENMLSFSSISFGTLEQQKERVNLSELIKEFVHSFQEQIQKSNYTVHLEIEVELYIQADKKQIEHVLTNLLSNAMKYGLGKPIKIKLHKQENLLLLSIRDHGLGISLADQKRIFQRFERAISARSISGFGVGLYICKEIIEAHSGTIHVESEIGQGSNFVVSLPNR